MKKHVSILLLLITFNSIAQMPKQWSSAEIYQRIKKLNVLGNVMYLAAHPDDENTRFISYSANEKLYNTAYLSLTRGDGGQNLIGTEIREELGIIRTQELLAARRTDGGMQFFTRANDFGYSKTPDETFEIWNKDQILADVVWAIRKFKPDVIVCRFPTDGGGGHGHHTASALLALEAFQLAGDNTKYTEQLQYVSTWQPTRVVINTGKWWNDSISADDEGVVAHNIGLYNNVLGTSYNELAARSRTMHKSQGFGSTGSRGEYEEFFEHLAGKEAVDDLFDGYSSNWSRVEGSEKIQSIINEIINNYQLNTPSSSVHALLQLKKEINTLKNEYWKSVKMQEIDKLIAQCLGLYIEATADDFSKTVGDSLKLSFEIINRSNIQVELINVQSDEISSNYESSMPKILAQNKETKFDVNVLVPSLPIYQPYWLTEEGTLGTYKVDNQLLIGTPENNPSVQFAATLKIDNELINVSFPLVYKWNDPVKGELYRPFIITPKLTVNIEQPIYLFSNESTKDIVLNLKSGAANQSGTVELETPKGWKVSFDGSFSLKNKGDEQKIIVQVTPQKGSENGSISVKVNDNEVKSMHTIQYDHIPTQVWFPESKAQLVFVDLVKKGERIGYIEGAGDVVPDALRNIGYIVDMLKEEDLELDNLKKYDAIITGIRFLNVNDRASFIMPKLLKYVEEGGNLVIQYNTRHALKTKNFSPYPITLSRDRVTEENAEVSFLLPNHNVLNTPNKITQADFDGWVQERGLYFPDSWDAKYDAILSWHDKDESDKKGALLVANYGKGTYTYTSISFFRELPAGVPGAYRLLVNLISQNNE